MGIRQRLFLLSFITGLIPLVVLALLSYWNGKRILDGELSNQLTLETAVFKHEVETALKEQESALKNLGGEIALCDYVRIFNAQGDSAANEKRERLSAVLSGNQNSMLLDSQESSLVAEVGVIVNYFFVDQKYGAALTCLNNRKKQIFRAAPRENGEFPVRFQTSNFPSEDWAAGENLWAALEQNQHPSPMTRGPTGVRVRYIAPVILVEPDGPLGALVYEIKGDALLKDVATRSDISKAPQSASNSPLHLIIALDHAGNIIYHPNEAHLYQPIGNAMPFFTSVAERMKALESGLQSYDAPDGHRWMVAYAPVESVSISVASAMDETVALGGLRRALWLNLSLAALFSLAIAAALMLIVRPLLLSLERVTEGAVAAAGGKLDQKIELRSHDDLRVVADSINVVNERLREQMAREAEQRQFTAFMRMSAMLTHDLKNAIAALSLIVQNMERHHDDAEFRADAMRSLTEATERLDSIVNKLSNPVETLSGEYKRPRPTDLVPVIRRVLSSTAEASATRYEIEMRLSDTLTAIVDRERTEKVIENLILNAMEAMGSAGGKLTIEGGSEDASHIFFSIADSGPGMSEEFLRTRLFRPFATTKKHGIGLGLYTCREVVRAQGGHIEVQSREGVGTTFRVVLPSEPDGVRREQAKSSRT